MRKCDDYILFLATPCQARCDVTIITCIFYTLMSHGARHGVIWLTQAQMAELFQKDQSVIARHINNALKEGELEENSNMHFLHNTQYKYRPTKT